MSKQLEKFYKTSTDVMAKRLVELDTGGGGGGGGVPPGGEADQILRKVSGDDFDTAWTDDLGPVGPEGPPGIQGDPGPEGPPGTMPLPEAWQALVTSELQWIQNIALQARRFASGQMTAIRGQVETVNERAVGERINITTLPVSHRPTQRFYRYVCNINSPFILRAYIEVEQTGTIWFHPCETIAVGARFNLGIEFHSWGPT